MCWEHGGEAIMARKEVKAEVTGKVWTVDSKVGDRVGADDVLLVLESMKMEIPVHAPVAGTVAEIRVVPEETVQEGAVVAVIET
jgi:acetyl-CoA carboxylase biotin carboxyl carrier protein